MSKKFDPTMHSKFAKEIEKSMSVTFDSKDMFFTVDRVTVAPKPTRVPGVHWDEIVGQVEAKAALREAIEGATKHAALYKRYGRKPSKGVLLYGPPGNGKTMLGKAAAESIAASGDTETGFIYVKGPEILNPFVGESEAAIRRLFTKAKDHKARAGHPAVIMIDEAESILSHRREQSMSATIVPAFLAEMDGMKDSGAFVILATNRPGSLDTAVIREGRIDRKILVGRPDRDTAVEMIRRLLVGRPVSGTNLSAEAASALFDSRHVLYNLHLSDQTTKSVTLGSLTSGAQITALVDAAATFAIQREIETGEAGGIEFEDFHRAVTRTLKEQREHDHPTELASFCEDFMDRIVKVDRVRANGVATKRPSLIANLPAGVELVGQMVPRC